MLVHDYLFLIRDGKIFIKQNKLHHTKAQNCWTCITKVLSLKVVYVFTLDVLFAECTAGYAGSVNSCTMCYYNTYKDTVGQSACKLCGSGYITTKIGATSSGDCGMYLR